MVIGPHPNRTVALGFIDALERRDWSALENLLDPGLVFEMPQSNERIRGRDRYVQFNREYPGEWHLAAKRVVVDDTDGVVLFDWRVGDEGGDAMTFLTFVGGRLATITDYWPEPYAAPPGREHLTEPIGPSRPLG